MSQRYYDNFIRQVPIFAQLPQPQLERIASGFQLRNYQAGEPLFREGDATQGLHIFVEGQAVLLKLTPEGRWQQVGLVREGHFLNQQALFQAGIESATLQAIQPVTALFLPRQNMANLLAAYPDLAVALGLRQAAPQAPPPAPKPTTVVTTPPEKIKNQELSFPMQREGERVLLMTRRHWWSYIRWIWLLLFFGIGFFAAGFAIPNLWLVFALLGVIVPLTFGIYLYMEWMNDSIIITDQRIIRITHTILTFSEVRDEVSIDSVQEANAEIPQLDPFALLFRYGYVELKTAGREGNLTLHFIPEPDDIQDLIMEDRRMFHARMSSQDQAMMRADIERWISGQSGTSVVSKEKLAGNKQRVYTPDRPPLSPFVTEFAVAGGGFVYRSHWFEWMRKIATPSLVIAVAVSLSALLVFLPPLRELGIIGWAGVMVLLLIGGVWFYFADWDWRHDYYLLSDTTISIIKQRPLWLQSERDQVLLKQVDNVVAETNGILQRLFKFGNVRIALVGADDHKVFTNVAHPKHIQNEISLRQAQMRQQNDVSREREQREIIGEYIQLYHQTVGGQPQASGAPAPTQAGNFGNTPVLRDRSRPPIVPQQQMPSISAPRPYQGGSTPSNNDANNNRPPRFPQRRNP